MTIPTLLSPQSASIFLVQPFTLTDHLSWIKQNRSCWSGGDLPSCVQDCGPAASLVIAQLSSQVHSLTEAVRLLQGSTHTQNMELQGCMASLGFSVRQIAAVQQAELVRRTAESLMPPGLQPSSVAAPAAAALSLGTAAAPPASKARKRARRAEERAAAGVLKKQRADAAMAQAAVYGHVAVLSPATKNLLAAQQQQTDGLAASAAAAGLVPHSGASTCLFPSAVTHQPPALAELHAAAAHPSISPPAAPQGASEADASPREPQLQCPVQLAPSPPAQQPPSPPAQQPPSPQAQQLPATRDLGSSQAAPELVLSRPGPRRVWTSWKGKYESLKGMHDDQAAMQPI